MSIRIVRIADVSSKVDSRIGASNVGIYEFDITGTWDIGRVATLLSEKRELRGDGSELRLEILACPQCLQSVEDGKFSVTLYLPGSHTDLNDGKFPLLDSVAPMVNERLAKLSAALVKKLPKAVDEAIEALDCGCDKDTMKKIAAAVLDAVKKG